MELNVPSTRTCLNFNATICVTRGRILLQNWVAWCVNTLSRQRTTIGSIPCIMQELGTVYDPTKCTLAWWSHQMETFSTLLALCGGNSPVTGEFSTQRPVTRSFDVCFDLCLNKQLSKQSRRRWIETPSCSLWRHCNGVLFSAEYKAWWALVYFRLFSVQCSTHHLLYIDIFSWCGCALRMI